ncbi:Mur ligase family protein [Methanobrevibacter acididurans]|uniref:Mur ligase family protein n=1 Tax=Methanobrevibacter acididurans TaxID=120963 RepID=UPI0038FD2F55
MNCIIIGAGNAGRPVARLLNHIGHDVTITDPKKLENFHEDFQGNLLIMENEGVTLDLGNLTPDLSKFDYVYAAPTLPDNSPAAIAIKNSDIKIISNDDFGRIVNKLIKPDIIGITGSVGKTSTTHIVDSMFRSAGYKIWKCSSMNQNLVSEVIVDGIIKGLPDKADIAILELPHGTAGLMGELNLKVGALLNIYAEHLSEFGGSMERYIQRKMFITKHSEKLISSTQCKDILKDIRPDTLYYGMVNNLPDNENTDLFKKLKTDKILISENQVCNFIGESGQNSIKIGYNFEDKNDCFESEFHMMSYYFENALAATAIAMAYGLDLKYIKQGLKNFKGLAVHMEYMGNYNGREVFIDASYLIEGMKATLEFFEDKRLVVLLDNFDTTTKRDKKETGKLIGKYADVMIATGFNEPYQKVFMEPAEELLNAASDSNAEKILAETMVDGAEMCIKYSLPGDNILHLGPQLMQNYESVRNKIVKGLEEGCKKYE